MLAWLRRYAARAAIEHELFERIVAQSRNPYFYSVLQVPDTMEGRCEMIMLHLSLVLGRLKREGMAGQRLGQALMERFFASMDDALRQIGIGDMGVPRRVKKTAAAFQERARDYLSALAAQPGGSADGGEDALAAAVRRHVLSNGEQPADFAAAAAIARYVRRSQAALAAEVGDRLFTGELALPAPASATEDMIEQ